VRRVDTFTQWPLQCERVREDMIRIDAWTIIQIIACGGEAMCGFWFMRLAIRSRSAPQWKRRLWLATSIFWEGFSLMSVAEAATTFRIFPAQQSLIRWLFILGLGELLIGYFALMFFKFPSLFHYWTDPIGDVIHDFRAHRSKKKRQYHRSD